MASPSVELLEDLCTRFILTAPAEQLSSFENLMFLVEAAHWYYEDNVRDKDHSLKTYSLKEFASLLFENSKVLKDHVANFERIFESFKEFKRNVPVMGAILLNTTLQKVLLVKGWKSASSWGFPRGKINKGETDAECAVREVYEETGYDIEKQLVEDDFIEMKLGGKRNKLYIVTGLDSERTKFAPQCKGEIGGYAWHRVTDLPATQDEANQVYTTCNGTKHKFFMVWPYVRPLRRWINRRQKEKGKPAAFKSLESAADLFNTAVVPPSSVPSLADGSINIPYSNIMDMLAAANSRRPAQPDSTGSQSPVGNVETQGKLGQGKEHETRSAAVTPPSWSAGDVGSALAICLSQQASALFANANKHAVPAFSFNKASILANLEF